MARAIVPLGLVVSTVYLPSVAAPLVVNNVYLDQKAKHATVIKIGLVLTATCAGPTTLARMSCLEEIDWERMEPATLGVRPFAVRTKSVQ